MIEILIPILATTVLLVILILGILLVSRFTEKSYQKTIFLRVLHIWVIMFAFNIYQQIAYADKFMLSYSGYLGNAIISCGVICQLSLIYYAASVLFHKRFSLKYALIFVAPAFISMAANVLWNLYMNYPFLHRYTTLAEFQHGLTTTTGILRLLMVAAQLNYMVFTILSIRKLIPIYNKYLQNTQSNERYNLNWLHTYSIALMLITAVYFIMIFHINSITITLYAIVTSGSFMMLFSCVREYDHFPKFNEVPLAWTFRKNWHLVEQTPTLNQKNKILQDKKLVDKIEKWIIKNKLYAEVDFSMKDLLNGFPELTSHDLIALLDKHGYTFQSFVRHIRIQTAINLISQNSDKQLLYKDIYYRVVFSHYSSFARAFTIVTGESPSHYNN